MGPNDTRSLRVLVIGILLILIWQAGFARPTTKIDDSYKLTASSGMHNERYFVYFWWYTGLFPLMSLDAVELPCEYRCASRFEDGAPGPLSKQAAEQIIHTRPDSLVMDLTWTFFPGDHGKIYLFWLDSWLEGQPSSPSIAPTNRVAFVMSLMALFGGLWFVHRWILGAFLVAFLGSNPFQIFEVYGNENIFGWPITAAILMLALHVPILSRRRIGMFSMLATPFISALLLAALRTVRPEGVPIALSCILAYTFANVPAHLRIRAWASRSAMILIFLCTFISAHVAWWNFIRNKYDDVASVLRSVGATPLSGVQRKHHQLWHPIFCGLGDFDTSHGYQWEDTAALAYAQPILERRHGLRLPSPSMTSSTHTDEEYADGAKAHYKILPYGLPLYEEVIRDKVLEDIAQDPLWYIGILGKRLSRLLTEFTPIRLSLLDSWITIPSIGFLFIPMVLFSVVGRRFFETGLLMFTLPTCLTALFIYSGRGTIFYGVFHLIAGALFFRIIFGALQNIWTRFVSSKRSSRPDRPMQSQGDRAEVISGAP